MEYVAVACPVCASPEIVLLGSSGDGTAVYLCVLCDDEFEVTPEGAG